jgi:PKD repeat protein
MRARDDAPKRPAARAAAAALLAGLSALALMAGPAEAATLVIDSTPALPRADDTTHRGDQITFTSRSTPGAGETLSNERWTFSDGGSGTGLSTTHTFTSSGSKTATLTVTVTPTVGTATNPTTSKTITVAANQAPVSSFRVTPAPPAVPTVGTAVTFTSTATDADGTIAAVSWDLNDDGVFGDATTRTAKRTYTTAGTFGVSLQVTDDLGATHTVRQTVTVNAPPVASFTFSPARPIAGDTLTFKSTSTDPDGTIASIAWDLDHDGLFNDATGPVAQRTFSTAGTYTVGLLVTDNNGATSATTATFTVIGNQPPKAAFAYTPSTPQTGQQVTFTSASKDPDGSIATTLWDTSGDGLFNDGRGPTARRTFNNAGNYTVSVKVTDDRGATDTAFQMVSVTDAPRAAAPSSGAPAALSPQGQKTASLLNPFPIVTLRGRLVRGGARIEALLVSQLPTGSRVEVRCAGKGCPFRSKVRKPKGRSHQVRFPELARRLRAGIVLRVIVTQPGRIGKYTRFKIRPSGAPSRKDLCVAPSAKRPGRCGTK